MGPPKAVPESAGLSQPYSFGGEDGEGTEEYLKKTSLSPWVPIPDPIARNLFDMARTGPEDVSCIEFIEKRMRSVVPVQVSFLIGTPPLAQNIRSM